MLKNIAFNVFLLINYPPPKYGGEKHFLTIPIAKMTETLSFSIIALFCILVCAISRMFRCLNLKAASLSLSAGSNKVTMSCSLSSVGFVSSKLENWRRHYSLVCQLVDQMNSCFGIIILVTMAHSFVNFTTDSFEVVLAFISNKKTIQTRFLILLFKHFFLLSSVCLGSYLLQSEVCLENKSSCLIFH